MDEEITIPTSADIYEACADYRQSTEGPTQPAFTHRTSLYGLCRAFTTRDGCSLSHDECPMKHYCWTKAWSDKTLGTLAKLIPAALLPPNSANNVQNVLVAAGKYLDRLHGGHSAQTLSFRNAQHTVFENFHSLCNHALGLQTRIDPQFLFYTAATLIECILVTKIRYIDFKTERKTPEPRRCSIAAGVSDEDWLRGKIACLEERVRCLWFLLDREREAKQNAKKAIKKAMKEKKGAAKDQAVKDKDKAQKENEGVTALNKKYRAHIEKHNAESCTEKST